MQVSVRLARLSQEHETVLRLVHDARRALGWSDPAEEAEGLWLTKQHALPSTNNIVVTLGDRVIGGLTLFGESAFRLPLEQQTDLTLFRRDLAGRLAEFSLPRLAPEFRQDPNLVLALYHYALCFGRTYCHYDAFVTRVPEAFASRYWDLLRYEPLPAQGQGAFLCRSARDGADFRESFADGFRPTFEFPERKFFLAGHQSLCPDVLNYLFNERTQLFARLSDQELRVLKNYYDRGAYASALPARPERRQGGQFPAHPRFPMNAEGYLLDVRGRRTELSVLDASREGLKVRAEGELKVGTVYAVTVNVGILRRAEVIAAAVWTNGEAGVAGLQVKSGDRNWQKLIEYLECDFLRAAG